MLSFRVSKEQGAGSRETRNKDQRAGSRKQEAGSKEQAAGNKEQEAGSMDQGAESWEQGAGRRVAEMDGEVHGLVCLCMLGGSLPLRSGERDYHNYMLPKTGQASCLAGRQHDKTSVPTVFFFLQLSHRGFIFFFSPSFVLSE